MILLIGLFIKFWLSPGLFNRDRTASTDLEMLLEEHTLVQENSLFQSSTPALTLVGFENTNQNPVK
ncbi:MAG: hypothetical protein D6814_12565 [Calditrichaeota bacterium]|nr:MAG: hypothetical protein D6814_12565 [Calditrichota bacterium]